MITSIVNSIDSDLYRGSGSGMAGVAFAIPLFSSVGTAIPHFESWTY